MNIRRSTMGILSGMAFLLSVGVAVAQELSPPGTVTDPSSGRTLHVSPQPLASIGPGLQFTTIGAAAKAVEPGDRVCIHSGVYRESVVIAKSGTPERPIRFEVEPAASVVVTGADPLSHWRKEADTGPDNVFSVEWAHSFIANPTHSHPDSTYHLLIGRAEQVFVQDYPLHQVLRRDQLSRGSFWVDEEHQRLYVWSATNEDLNGLRVEASVRPVLWQCQGDYVQLRGVRFRYAANSAQQQAAEFDGRGDVIEDCIFEDTNGVGAGFHGSGQIVRRCTFQDNGQMGFGVYNAHSLLMTGCLTRGNNTKNFSRGWEAGGDKIVLSRKVIIEKSRFVDNRGTGLWFDIGNETCTVRNCFIAGNEDAGIFYEISYGLRAHDNVIIGNGLADTPGAWGGGSGIAVSSSPGCVIERNLLIGNKEGFDFREQERSTPHAGQTPGTPAERVWIHDEVIRHNVLAYNRDAQTWGWFDIHDERHWPRAMQTHPGPAPSPPSTADDAAQDDAATPGTGMPAHLALEDLHIVFADNVYATREGEGLFHWGTAWLRHQYFANLDTVREELNLERGSVVSPFVFADYLTRDFRVPADSAALDLDAYPRGDVPETRLGMLPSADTTGDAEP